MYKRVCSPRPGVLQVYLVGPEFDDVKRDEHGGLWQTGGVQNQTPRPAPGRWNYDRGGHLSRPSRRLDQRKRFLLFLGHREQWVTATYLRYYRAVVFLFFWVGGGGIDHTRHGVWTLFEWWKYRDDCFFFFSLSSYRQHRRYAERRSGTRLQVEQQGRRLPDFGHCQIPESKGGQMRHVQHRQV